MASPTKNQNLVSVIKQENLDFDSTPSNFASSASGCTSGSGDGSSPSTAVGNGNKRKQAGFLDVNSSKKAKSTEMLNSSVVPPGFLARNAGSPPPAAAGEVVVESPVPLSVYYENSDRAVAVVAPAPVSRVCRQFWRAGDYEEVTAPDTDHCSVGMDHARVHPKFLHSNATSHKWALGAFAELLDNALDEVANGATYVHVDVLTNQRDQSPMLLVEDNGGGMNAHQMRRCMSLGYSSKSKMANTIGQYGNGFKTSCMRLGADVIAFSRCNGDAGTRATLSVGLLSYTFLTATGQEDIVVPSVTFERKEDGEWAKVGRSSEDWDATFEIILKWSPFATSEDFFDQLNLLENQGTRIIIYNLWEEDNEGHLELDFDADTYDIQIRGINKDEKMIKMASQFPSANHFLTYKHSLRSYASILYMKLPSGFKILLRGKEIEHHDVVDDMKMVQDIIYRPMNPSESGNMNNNQNIVATGKMGFLKDADHHIEVQGFNVYHKNRLIQPYWRVWNAAGSDGRGVIGVIEANFIEPAHDKQGFERTISLKRLENRLVAIQKNYWASNCHEIGYAARRGTKKRNESSETSTSQQSSAPEIRTSPSVVNPVTLPPHRPSYEQIGSSSIDRAKLSWPEPVINSLESWRNLQTPPHLRHQGGIRINGPNIGNVESVFLLSQAGTKSSEVDGLKKALQMERDIRRKVECQLTEEKLKSQSLEKEIVALLKMLQEEKDLNTGLQCALKERNLKN